MFKTGKRGNQVVVKDVFDVFFTDKDNKQVLYACDSVSSSKLSSEIKENRTYTVYEFKTIFCDLEAVTYLANNNKGYNMYLHAPVTKINGEDEERYYLTPVTKIEFDFSSTLSECPAVLKVKVYCDWLVERAGGPKIVVNSEGIKSISFKE